MDKVNCAQITKKYADLLRLRNEFFALAGGGWTTEKVKISKINENDIRLLLETLRKSSQEVLFLGQRMQKKEKIVLRRLMEDWAHQKMGPHNLPDREVMPDEIAENLATRIKTENGRVIELDLSDYGFFMFPECIGKLKGLKFLNLSFNALPLDRKMYTVIGGLTELAVLDISDNQIDMDDPWVQDVIDYWKHKFGDGFIY